MADIFNLEAYLSQGVENIVKDSIRTTLKNPRQSLFLAKYAISSKESTKQRQEAFEEGLKVPPFLISSITSSCNLHCAGCYARSNHSCSDITTKPQLTKGDWQRVFMEAKDLGIGFILLAGGEPMIRTDVIEVAGKIPEIIFPIFTNGTLIDESTIKLLNQSRNLMPVISIEGHEEKTDNRRGDGVFKKVINSMETMKKKNIMFGSSITVTKDNLEEVLSDTFIKTLEDYGSKVVFYVEYVPVSEDTFELAPGDQERQVLMDRLKEIRKDFPEMMFIAFPGDEKSSGGCLAAGRGFFHINAEGGAEPCPFSPFSDINVKEKSLKEALESRLFKRLQEDDILLEDHAGGCILFEKRELVESLL